MLISLNRIFKFITATCNLYNIDESHGIRHSIDMLCMTKNIFNEEKVKFDYLKNKEHIVYTSALLHDMCDHKYMKPEEGINNIKSFLLDNKYNTNDINTIVRIMNNMSYSKIKKNGFPFHENDNDEFIKMFHIVREADLMCAYEVERCIIYDIFTNNNNNNFITSYDRANDLFKKRMFKHYDDNLFTTSYALREGKNLELDAKLKLDELKNIINDISIDEQLL